MDIRRFFQNVAQLSIKMRIFRAIQTAGSETGELKDREILILELLNTQGPMSMTDLLHFFPGIKQSTLSTDVKRLRAELDLVDMTVDRNDMRIHRIELSAKGRAKVEEIQQQRAQSYEPLATAIGDVPDEIEVLNRVVERTIQLVDQKINQHAEAKNQGPGSESIGNRIF
jgi:DNA-binding MarR family transcriptional regulator